MSSAPPTSLTVSKSESGEQALVRIQSSLDSVADLVGGREQFLEICHTADTSLSRSLLSAWALLTLPERDRTTLQDLCVRTGVDATDLVGSIMGKLIMQHNNVSLLLSALRRPDVMNANINMALGDDELALKAQIVQFQVGGLLKGEGKTIQNLTMNVQGTGIMSFEDDSHASVKSVRSGGAPATPQPPAESLPIEADSSIVDDK